MLSRQVLSAQAGLIDTSTASSSLTTIGIRDWAITMRYVLDNEIEAYHDPSHREWIGFWQTVYNDAATQQAAHDGRFNIFNPTEHLDPNAIVGLDYGFGDFAVQNMPAVETVTPQREAIEKARLLLLSCLSDLQRRQFEANGWFDVVAQSGTRYRITKGWGGNVFSIHNDRRRDRYCIHPSSYVPEEDNMLAQKLLLETDERTFLRVANRSAA
jgi:hypothetical protein